MILLLFLQIWLVLLFNTLKWLRTLNRNQLLKLK
nr:MAG TPA: hypothetical protein [Crassvirales sp.]DAK71256.1 MAG TPA: hypothetical protein [Caudoviricetes sp.]DAP79236.1 MAG TPA: hypothetical protein [Caudoviricetes sp.]